MMITPILTLVTKSPRVGLLSLIAGVAGLLSHTVINFVTLPVEIDASFRRALPLLEKREDFSKADQEGAHQILRPVLILTWPRLIRPLNIMRWLDHFKKKVNGFVFTPC